MSFLTIGVVGVLATAGDSPKIPSTLFGTYSATTNYEYLASQLNAIIAKTTSAQHIGTAIQAVFNSNPLSHSNNADWVRIRANMAANLFTNLALLEAGLRQTSAVTNVSVVPIPANEYVVDAKQITDPTERHNLLACRAALKAHGELWNLNQALKGLYQRYWNDAISLLAAAYSRPPSAATEVQRLLADYGNYDCAVQFSNKLRDAQQ